jgi:acylphosphatase
VAWKTFSINLPIHCWRKNRGLGVIYKLNLLAYNPNMRKTRVHLYISGLVQGVFFRQYTKQKAERLGVFGWVRNLPDARVEAVFEGEESAVKELVEICRKGPSKAIVENVEVAWEDFLGEFRDFSIK